MKKLLVLLAIVFVSYVSYGQVVSRTASSANPVKLIYQKDEFKGTEYLLTKTNLFVSNDGKEGFKLSPYFKKENGKWNYAFLAGVSSIGTCFEKDKIYILFDDGSRFEMTSCSVYNCNGDIVFDLHGEFRGTLSSMPMKGIRFENGVDHTLCEKIFTNENDKNYFINAFKALEEHNATH